MKQLKQVIYKGFQQVFISNFKLAYLDTKSIFFNRLEPSKIKKPLESGFKFQWIEY
jgi:hypothetical protein